MHLLAVFALLAAPPPIAPLSDTPLKSGTVGVSFAFPDADLLPAGGGAPTVGVTYFLANDMAAHVDFGLDATFSPSGTPAGFSILAALRFYRVKHDHVGVFLQPSFAFGRDKTSATEFIAFGGAVGVEYFFNSNLSAGGTLGLALTLNNIGGPAGTSVGTELTTATSGIFANVYF